MVAQNPQNKEPVVTSFGVLAIHIFWLLIGPLVLMLLAFHIVQSGAGWITVQDIAFFLIVGLMIIARWLERRSGQETTIEGTGSTPRQFRQYVLRLVTSATAIWLVVNMIGNHLITNITNQ